MGNKALGPADGPARKIPLVQAAAAVLKNSLQTTGNEPTPQQIHTVYFNNSHQVCFKVKETKLLKPHFKELMPCFELL